MCCNRQTRHGMFLWGHAEIQQVGYHADVPEYAEGALLPIEKERSLYLET